MNNKDYDVIIIGGSYAGLAAAMALGRALRKVLVIDSGKAANRYTPHSHNFITHDGRAPGEITKLATEQVDQYPTVNRLNGFVVSAKKTNDNFAVTVDTGTMYLASRLIFATGIIDLLPEIPGFAECWGKSVLHCPYCHGYEVRHEKTAIIGNGEYAFEFGAMISNWTNDLTVFTHGPSAISADQTEKLTRLGIQIVSNKIAQLQHHQGYLSQINFNDGSTFPVAAIYARPEFRQHSNMPAELGCSLTPDGYIAVDPSFQTTIAGVYACGDNITRLRTVANAVAMGTTTGMMVNKELTMRKVG